MNLVVVRAFLVQKLRNWAIRHDRHLIIAVISPLDAAVIVTAHPRLVGSCVVVANLLVLQYSFDFFRRILAYQREIQTTAKIKASTSVKNKTNDLQRTRICVCKASVILPAANRGLNFYANGIFKTRNCTLIRILVAAFVCIGR